jgi:RNA polymerase sigma factor (sigma-70 family)
MVDAADRVVACIPHLRRYARALTGEPHYADDLVQDTLERAWRGVHLWRGGDDIRPWLFSILHNCFINDARRRRRTPLMLPLDDAATAASPANAEVTVEFHATLSALDLLAVEQRTVLLLVALEGFSYREVAEILKVPIGTVMSRLSRARESLRATIGGTNRGQGTGRREPAA